MRLKILAPATLWLTVLATLITACSKSSEKNEQANYAIDGVDSLHIKLNFSSGVRAILEDSKGNIWLGSGNEGVVKFNGRGFDYFTVENGLSHNEVRSIFEDENGKIWIEWGEGISVYNGMFMSVYQNQDYSSKENWSTSENDLWFKANPINGYNGQEGQPGVYRYDGLNMSYHTFPLKGRRYGGVSTRFSRGQNGQVWFGTYSAVIGYQDSTFTIIDNNELGLNDSTGYLHVRSLLEDSKGNLWIGNNGIGVWLYDGDTTVNFSQKHGLVSGLSERRGGHRSAAGNLEHVFAIFEDRDGNIWFGDRDTGAWKYDGQSFTNYTIADGLTVYHIWQIYQCRSGQLLFAMADGAGCLFDGESFKRVF